MSLVDDPCVSGTVNFAVPPCEECQGLFVEAETNEKVSVVFVNLAELPATVAQVL